MFAGAAREVVFSNPKVVERIKTSFIPVALKAATVQNPPRGPEGELYRELLRTQPATQGICVMSSTGQVLDWVLSFADDEAVVEYFNDVLERYKSTSNQQKTVVRRFRSFPNRRLSDIPSSGTARVIPLAHDNDGCPATMHLPPGTLQGKVIGRPIGVDSKALPRTLRQEEYMEAKLQVDPNAIASLVDACLGNDEVEVPDLFVRSVVGPAYLGQLDVSPLISTPKMAESSHWWKFRATRVDEHLIRISGQSHIEAAGSGWDHAVTLSWQGYVKVEDDRGTAIELLAKGHERLHWMHDNTALQNEPDAAHLMAGHPIGLDSPVVYGIHASVR